MVRKWPLWVWWLGLQKRISSFYNLLWPTKETGRRKEGRRRPEITCFYSSPSLLQHPNTLHSYFRVVCSSPNIYVRFFK
jgi:hypothetical protein